MEMVYSPEAEAFRTTVKSFLKENLPEGFGGIGTMEGLESDEFVTTWRKTLFEHGYLAATWPKEYGGAGLSAMETVILAEEFTKAGTTQFGSGWAWLVDDGSGLKIMQTANADLPMKHDAKALLTIDVWEHAYYVDYRNARPTYIETFLDKLVNWDHVAVGLGV